LSTDFAASILSVTEKWRRLPPARSRARRPFLDEGAPLPEKVLYDTTVYIDVLQGKLSRELQNTIAQQNPWHTTVTESELTYLYGRLDPGHANTPLVVRAIQDQIDRWPHNRVLNPDRRIWREAAILTGVISRLHRAKTEDRGRLMNDALIFLTALQHGCTVLTRNVRDFDLLQQLIPDARVAFYRIA
jgi:predicted nucleic acid-binding protein